MGRRTVTALCLAAVVIVGPVGLLAHARARDEPPASHLCADVGVIGPTRATAREALDAFLVRTGASLEEWVSSDWNPNHSFVPVDRAHARPNFSSLEVGEYPGDGFQVEGGCV